MARSFPKDPSQEPSAPTGAAEAAAFSPFGRLLRFWRDVFGLSQETLAHEIGSSSRHVSRMENGLAQPSKAMVLRIARQFELGERDSMQLLFAAGYTAVAAEADLADPDMRWLRKSMARLLASFEPAPAMLTSGSAWILMVNRAWLAVMRAHLPEGAAQAARLSTRVYYDALFSSDAPAGDEAGWRDSRIGILMALQQEAILRDDAELQATVDQLSARHGFSNDWKRRAAGIRPMGSFRVYLRCAGRSLPFNQVAMTVGQRGTTTFLSEPRLRVTALLPSVGALDPAFLDAIDSASPLLCDSVLSEARPAVRS